MIRLGVVLAGALLVALPVHAQQSPPAAALGAQPDAAEPIDPERLAAARLIIDAILPPDRRDAIFAQLVDTMMSNMIRGLAGPGSELDKAFQEAPEARGIFANFVTRQRDLAQADLKSESPRLIDAYCRVYARKFTLDEMRTITTFFTSPTGKKYYTTALSLMADPEVAKWQADVMARGQARLPAEIQRLKSELEPILRRKANSHAS